VSLTYPPSRTHVVACVSHDLPFSPLLFDSLLRTYTVLSLLVCCLKCNPQSRPLRSENSLGPATALRLVGRHPSTPKLKSGCYVRKSDRVSAASKRSRAWQASPPSGRTALSQWFLQTMGIGETRINARSLRFSKSSRLDTCVTNECRPLR